MLISRIVEDDNALFLAVENLGPISLVFGNDVAASISDQIGRCARALSDGRVELEPLSPTIFTLRRPKGRECADLPALEDLCTLISATPLYVHGTAVMVTASLHECLDTARAACAQHQSVMSDEFVLRYRSDMALASKFVEAVSEGGLVTLWRPVRSSRVPDLVLHYEAVHRLLERDGRYRDCSAERDALERLGMAWIFDRAKLMAAIDELYADSRPCISVQLAATSLQRIGLGSCGRWLAALQRLKARPDVAARLVIEISGPFGGASVESIRDSVADFRHLGASLSVSNFASSDLNFGALVALDPDIVKISATFMHGATRDSAGCRRLQLLFKLAVTMSRTVVVEGVDGDRHMQIARVLGADWVKGQQVGEPSFGRHWKIVAAATSPAMAAANCEDGSAPLLRTSAW